MRGSLRVAVAMNAAVAIGALAAHLRGRSGPAPLPPTARGSAPEAGAPRFATVLGIAALGGAVSPGPPRCQHPHRRFDAIVSNTTYHFRANAGALLSSEFLALVREHLAPGGVALYNTTGSARAQRTGCLAFPHGARFSNELVVSTAPLELDFERWRRTLEACRIDGRPVLDPARPEDARALDGLVALHADLHPDRAGRPSRQLEPCPEIVARTAGLEPITDDNMGSEWRIVFGLE
jgi:hypothetical protein